MTKGYEIVSEVLSDRTKKNLKRAGAVAGTAAAIGGTALAIKKGKGIAKAKRSAKNYEKIKQGISKAMDQTTKDMGW